MCKKGTQTIMFVLFCYGIKYINSKELFFSEIKPFRRSRMILSFLRFLFFRENKLSYYLQQSSLRRDWQPVRYTSNVPILVRNIQTLCFHQLKRMAETDSCIWFCIWRFNRYNRFLYLKSPETKIWYLIYRHDKHILNINPDWC